MGLVWNGRPVSSQASAFSLFCPLRPSRPPLHIPEHSRAGVSPRPPGLPGEGLHTFLGVVPHHPCPWDGDGLACCHCVGTSERALPLLLKDGTAGPLRGPLTTLSLSQGQQKRGKVPALGFVRPPHTCSSSHCDSALLPTHTRCGRGAPQEVWLGSSSGLSYF